jgi:hypothetical protein
VRRRDVCVASAGCMGREMRSQSQRSVDGPLCSWPQGAGGEVFKEGACSAPSSRELSGAKAGALSSVALVGSLGGSTLHPAKIAQQAFLNCCDHRHQPVPYQHGLPPRTARTCEEPPAPGLQLPSPATMRRRGGKEIVEASAALQTVHAAGSAHVPGCPTAKRRAECQLGANLRGTQPCLTVPGNLPEYCLPGTGMHSREDLVGFVHAR